MPQINKPVLFYDGFCALCNYSVNFVIRNLYTQQFFFAPLSGNHASEILIHAKKIDSIILFLDGKFYYKSEALFKVIALLHPRVRWMLIFKILPLSVTDFVYDKIAKYRYKIWGKYNTCKIPPVEIRHLFLD